MAEENLNNENPTPDFDPGFDLGQYIETDYVEPPTAQPSQPTIQPRMDINAELGYNPEEELSKYMAQNFKTSVDAGMVDPQDLQNIDGKLDEDPFSIDAIRAELDKSLYYNKNTATDPFASMRTQIGDFRDPNNQNMFYKRYYNHPKFDQLGFTPFRNNEEYYNQNSTTFDDMRRSAGEFMTLAGIGWDEGWGLSDLEDISTAKQYAESAAIGTSSRKNVGAFLGNTFMNAGYMIGLTSSFAAENAALIGLEFLGGLAAPATGGGSLAVTGAAATRQAYSAARFSLKMKKAFESAMKARKIVDKMQDASKARKFFKAAMDFANPLENTTHFFKNLDQMSDMTKLARTVRGSGGFIKDVRNVAAAWNEAALEANMVQDEMQRTLLAEFKKKNNGRSPNEQEAQSIINTVKQATASTASWNTALILGTNKLTLGPLMRPMSKGLGGGIFSVGKAGSKFIYTASKKGVPEAYKLLSQNYAKRSLELLRHPKALLQRQLIYSADNIAEGVQEVSQETIADWQKEYHTSMFQGNENRGAYYDYLGKSLEKQMSPEGFEVFMSGFLMQKMAGPIINAGGAIGQAITKGETYSDLKLFATDREAYYKNKKDRRKQDEAIVNKLNDFYQNNTEYLAGDLMQFVRQGEYVKMLKNAETAGDAKSYHDVKDSARFDNIMNLIQYGRLDSHLELLTGLKDLTAEEVQQEYNMEKSVFDDVIDKSVERAKMIEQTYKGLQTKMPNPVNYKKFKPGSAERLDAEMSYKAWNDTLASIAFNKYSFNRALERASSILDQAHNNLGLKNTTFSEFNVLFGKTALGKELQVLQMELGTLKDSAMMTDDIKKQIKDKEEKVKLLKEFSADVDNLLKNSPNESIDAESELYESLEKTYGSYVNYLAKKNGDAVDSTQIAESLNEIIDYYKLTSRSEGIVNAVNLMIDPDGFNQLVRRNKDVYDNAMSSMKEEIEKSYQAYKKGNKLHNDLVNALADKGVFITLEDLEALRDKGVYPEHFYFSSSKEDNIELAHNTPEYREIVEIMREYFDIKEGIDAATFEEQYSIYNLKSRNKKKDDQRTYDDLAEQFGFKEGEEVPVKQVLEAVINSKYTDAREKALAELLYDQVDENEMMVFSKEASLPAEYNVGEDKVVINATFSANEYKQGRINSPLEYFILHGMIQKRLDTALDQDANFKSDMEQLLKESQEAWKALTPEEKKKYAAEGNVPMGLTNINDFAFAAMTNQRMQRFLGTVKTSTQQDSSSLWKKFVDTVLNRISSILKTKNVEGTVLNAALGIITTKIDPAGVKPATSAPKSTGTGAGVSRSMPVSEIKANHPELYNSLLDAFIAYNEGRVEQGNESVIPENASRDQIGKLPFFTRFVNDRAFTSPDKIFKEYNAKIGAKAGAGTTTTTGSVPITITKAVRQQLLDLGYSRADINKMKPEEAQEIIKNQTTKPKEPTSKDDSGKRTMPKAPAEEIVYIAPKSGIATREVTSKLRELGFTAADISAMSDAQKYQYANDNLTKQESKEWYDFIKEQDEDFTAQRDVAETARQEINAVIESATTYEEWLDLPNKIYGQDMQNTFIQSNYTVANIKSLLDEKLKRLAFISNFKDVKVGEFIGIERVNKKGQKYVAIVTVSAKDKDSITLQYLAPNAKGEYTTFKINKKDLKDTKMYKSSEALDNVDIDEGPVIDPQGNDAAKQSVTNLNDINFDNAEIESTADSKTSEEVDNDFLNDIKNNCE